MWALEVLLTLKAERRAWSNQDIVEKLRASELVVTKALDALVSAGLASVESGGALYLPVNREVEAEIARVEELYRARPNAVRRAIVSAATSSATAFADAFQLRRDSDD